MKKDQLKAILYALYGIFAISILIILRDPFTIGKGRIKEFHFNGVITSKFYDKSNRNVQSFRLNSDSDFDKMNAEFWPGSWDYAQEGDSIIKPADTLIIVIRKPDNSSEVFHYK